MADQSMVEKGKEDTSATRRKTLFVRNLPFSTTDRQLEDAFGNYGPIKRCFVVKDRGKIIFQNQAYTRLETLLLARTSLL